MDNNQKPVRRTYTVKPERRTAEEKPKKPSGTPAWLQPKPLIIGGLSLVAVTVLVFVLQGLFAGGAETASAATESASPAGGPPAVATVVVDPAASEDTDTDAAAEFHGQFSEQLTARLRRIGIRPALLTRLAGANGSPDQWTVRVPGNFPPLRLNAEVTSLTASLEGEVYRAEQDSSDLSRVNMAIGAGNLVTDRVTLDQDPDLLFKGTLAFIIDDCGNRPVGRTARFLELAQPVTLSVFPHHRHSQDVVEAAVASGGDAMLHLPMQPVSEDAPLEANTILTTMSDEQISEIARNAVEAVPGIAGVNNHQGSAATQDSRVMNTVISAVHAVNPDLFFLDSGTIPFDRSVVQQVAAEHGVLSGRNRFFLDDYSAVDDIAGQIRRAAALAEAGSEYGPPGQPHVVIAIGHDRDNTLAALVRELPLLEAEGFRICPVSELVR